MEENRYEQNSEQNEETKTKKKRKSHYITWYLVLGSIATVIISYLKFYKGILLGAIPTVIIYGVSFFLARLIVDSNNNYEE